MVTIEVLGIGFPNKGAELMLAAISQWASGLSVESRLAVRWEATFQNRLRNRLWARVWHPPRGLLPYGYFVNRWPARICERLGIVRESDIDIFLDASGYAYGDPWGKEKANGRLGSRIAAWRRQGSHIVLLPQAFGPFLNAPLRAEMQRIVRQTHKIYARDDISLNALQELAPDCLEIERGYDFTCLVEPRPFAGMESLEGAIGLIPNHKMYAFGDRLDRTKYVEYFKSVACRLVAEGYKVALILHEGREDQAICEEVSAATAGAVKVVALADPRETKMAIGLCRAVLSSRFHGFASALFQSVPALATSWSHKYRELARDCAVPDAVLDSLDPVKTVALLKTMSDDEASRNLRHKLMEQTDYIKKQTKRMWCDIEALVFGAKREQKMMP